jgi:hypothetical protein
VQGPQGLQGNDGADGVGVSIAGEASDPTELPDPGTIGEGYLIEGILWLWDDGQQAWYSTGATLRGPQGIQGIQGVQGPEGAQGVQGLQGAQGNDGAGVPLGGSEGQFLAKLSDADLDTEWASIPAASLIKIYLGPNMTGNIPAPGNHNVVYLIQIANCLLSAILYQATFYYSALVGTLNPNVVISFNPTTQLITVTNNNPTTSISVNYVMFS